MKINLNFYLKLDLFIFLSGSLVYITIGFENLNPKILIGYCLMIDLVS